MCARSASARILIASADFPLSQSRKHVIEQEPSWEATITRNKQHGLALLHNETFDLLLLCSSLGSKTQVEYASIFRRRNPAGKVIAVENRIPLDIPADAVLPIPVAPRELIRAIRGLLATRTNVENDGDEPAEG